MEPTRHQLYEFYAYDMFSPFFHTAGLLDILHHTSRTISYRTAAATSRPCILLTTGIWTSWSYIACLACTGLVASAVGAPHRWRDPESGRTALEIGQQRRERWNHSHLMNFINIGGYAGLFVSWDRVMAGRVRPHVRLLRSMGAMTIGTLAGAGAFVAWNRLQADGKHKSSE